MNKNDSANRPSPRPKARDTQWFIWYENHSESYEGDGDCSYSHVLVDDADLQEFLSLIDRSNTAILSVQKTTSLPVRL